MNGSKFEMDRPRGSRGAPRGGPRGAPRGMSRGRGGPPGMRGPPVRDSRPPFKDSRGPPMGRESRGPPMRESRGPPRESRGPPMGRGPPRESFGERSSYGGRSSEYKDPYREPLPSRDFGERDRYDRYERDRGYSTGGGESYRDYGAPSSRSYLSDHRDRDYPPARDPYGPPSRGDDYGSREYGSSSRWVSGAKDSRESRFGDSMGGRGDYGGGFSRDLELPPSRSSYEMGHSRDYDSGRGGAYDSYSTAPRGYEGGSRSNGMSSRGPPSRGPPSRGPPARSLMSGSPPRGPPSMRDRRPPREGESRRPPPPRDMEPPMKRPRGDSPPRRGGSSLRSFGGDRGRGGSRGMPRGRGRGAPMGMGGRGRGGRGSPRGMPPRR